MANSEELSPVKRALLELRDLRNQLDELESQRTEPIAIIGMGLRFPGDVHTPESFWELLRNGVDAIEPIPPERWNIQDYFNSDYTAPGKMYTRGGGFLRDINRFDAAFFGISPREATSMDPQQRLLLEVAWEALENAGQSPNKLYNSQTGVFLAIGNSDYTRMVWADTENIDVYYATGTAYSVAAGRLSYLLGLQGPSLILDTACSGSLVAIHLACQSLRSRESSLALVGGVNLILSPEGNINFSKAQMLAPDDRCKTFDAAADGYVRSEGCGVVVLKRLTEALADNDTIYAVIRGSAVNQDGRSSGLTAPNGPSQEAVIRTALTNAGVTPEQVQYVEAHGTGTSLGDPIEVQALSAALGTGRETNNRLKIGSVKTNIGHLEAAAGIAGLIKTVLSLYHEAIPPHLNLNQLNPYIDWANTPIDVPTHLTPWSRGQQPRIAGVSSFGFSGTNAHVILEEAPLAEPIDRGIERPLHLLTLSGKSSSVLQKHVEQFITFLNQHDTGDFPAVLYTANAGRSHFNHRLAVSAATSQEMQEKLQAWLQGNEVIGLQAGQHAEAPELTFLFSGQGEQYVDMGKRLYETQPLFRAVMEECQTLLQPYLPKPLLSVLYPESGTDSPLEEMKYAQTAIFSIEYALAKLWASWGIMPTMVLGHSVGEYAAACFAGVFSLADGLKLVAARGRLMDDLAQKGTMVAVFAEEDVVRRAVAAYADHVSVAAVNAPGNIVISGEVGALETVVQALRAEGIRSKRLAVTQASHSPLMEPMLDEFEAVARTVAFRSPKIGYVSGMIGRLVSGNEISNAAYWRRHSREAVQFSAGIQTLYDEGYRIFVEIGPNPSLLSNARRTVPEENSLWLPTLRKGWEDWTQILDSLSELYVAGVEVDWEAFDKPYLRHKLPIPTYLWEGGRYWVNPVQPAHQDSKPIWDLVVNAGRRQSRQGPLELAPQTFVAKWDVLARLTRAYIIHALREWGVFTKAGERHTIASLLENKGIEATYDHLLGRWLDSLSEVGLIQHADTVYSNRAPLPEPDLSGVRAEARAAFADASPLLDYVERCGESLVSVLTGRESPLETLFPGGSYDTVDYLYHDFQQPVYFNNIVCAAILAAVEAAGTRTLRILEAGAGTGGTTATLLPELATKHVVYQFTDVSDFFLTRAQQKFAAYPFVQYSILNLETDPAQQGYAPGSVDVVVASNVLHATRNLDQTLRYLRNMLVPGGLLILYETTNPLSWYDITTGLIEGWQLFEDNWRGDNPLLSAPRWAEALQANGFDTVTSFPEPDALTANLGQHIIIARTPGGTANLGTSAQSAMSSSVTISMVGGEPVPENDEAAAFISALGAMPQNDQIDALVDLVRAQVRRVLRLDASSSIDRRDRLMDIGFDSLMAVELRAKLTSTLGLSEKLPATLIFDYPTPEAIAKYLIHVLALDNELLPTTAASTPSRSQQIEPETDLQGLTDEEIEAMLLKKLKDIQ